MINPPNQVDVLWGMSTPPQGSSWQTHKFSYVDALLTASYLFDADDQVGCQKLYVGHTIAGIIESLPLFTGEYHPGYPLTPVPNEPDVYVLGGLGRWRVYLSTKMTADMAVIRAQSNKVKVIKATGSPAHNLTVLT